MSVEEYLARFAVVPLVTEADIRAKLSHLHDHETRCLPLLDSTRFPPGTTKMLHYHVDPLATFGYCKAVFYFDDNSTLKAMELRGSWAAAARLYAQESYRRCSRRFQQGGPRHAQA